MKKVLAVCALSVTVCWGTATPDYPYQPVPLNQVVIREGFWLPRFETNRLVTVWADFRKSEETGRISNFARAGKLEEGPFRGIPFDDLDVSKSWRARPIHSRPIPTPNWTPIWTD